MQLEGIAGIGCVELRRQCGGGSRDSGPAQLQSLLPRLPKPGTTPMHLAEPARQLTCRLMPAPAREPSSECPDTLIPSPGDRATTEQAGPLPALQGPGGACLSRRPRPAPAPCPMPSPAPCPSNLSVDLAPPSAGGDSATLAARRRHRHRRASDRQTGDLRVVRHAASREVCAPSHGHSTPHGSPAHCWPRDDGLGGPP